MKSLSQIIFVFLLLPTLLSAQSEWGEGGMLGILEESLSYIDVSGENNLDQSGVQEYFTKKFDKTAFDKIFRETAEYGWDTTVYHYLSSLWFLSRPDIEKARNECYAAGQSYANTSPANRNVLSRFGLPLDRIDHLREYIDFGEHRNDKSLGFDGGKEVKGYSGYADHRASTVPAFPWPPPQASTDFVLPQEVLTNAKTLGGVDAKISYALTSCGYHEKSYFTVPGGFALVTRMEQFNDDGSPKKGDDRWNVSLKPSQFDLSEYFKALFWGRKGRYRIIVFIVTDEAFHESDEGASSDMATQWLRTGAKYLPTSISEKPLRKGHRCTAMVYEFELKESLTEPRFASPSSNPGLVHIQRSGILDNIK